MVFNESDKMKSINLNIDINELYTLNEFIDS